jgi:hypothetical protein
MPLENPKRKTHKVHMNESQNNFFLKKIIKHKILRNKNSISKGLLKIRSNFDPSKVNIILLSKKLKIYVTPSFIISF